MLGREYHKLVEAVKRNVRSHDVSGTDITAYQRFCLQAARAKEHLGYSELQVHIQSLVEQYVETGLERGILCDLLKNLLSIRPPE
ncbi:hypothetical protein CH330_07645 [candidate division WOR-3 bacterium JGI_Cruoil_03_51_56]|uniref:Uncharacterized protein n=1 Tax=candidate division WOR-3 bacterium JGI_Cruoil_03_51_56 TaxID=1973747 RepID=A0A235BT89_UNCW3|nr:MAG: hypothetical protein CH330_07645 [candidate division WOR-3 bacterium JGI_Cruoil_03_51_56]